ncbi:FAD-binding oxidoreductase [Streptomyces sp. ODS28]|uniref:NAD(P)/FAD-dependent oxidoreductase n=1 Tax=Streptomyces sp. ODS28 TaxID=3136688 RepID=UPI0031F03BCD
MPLNGHVSFWHQQVGHPSRRAPLDGGMACDVCVVGAGLTGLWAAYYLKQAEPSLRIAVVEREFAGFGASGRNGGWLSAKLPVAPARIAREHGTDAVRRMQRALEDTVDEALEVTRSEGIHCDAVKSGCLTVAHRPAHLPRLRAAHDHAAHWGARDTRWLDAAELGERLRLDGALAAHFDPHCARVQPARLVRGLAATVEALGVRIFESTPVTELAAGRAVTPFGTVRARHVLRATEGFTSDLPGERRTWLPMNSSMIVTAPLPEEVWERIGWSGQELLGDIAHAFTYGQRTADGRIAVGGRGAPYRFGSHTDRSGRTAWRTVRALRDIVHRFFPDTARVPVEHAWSGVLAVPRDWCASVHYDPRSGLGSAGGYSGHGVSATNLAGRTLRDLVLERDSELTALPWVGHRTRAWEPEPARWLGVHGMYAAYRAADRAENGRRVTTSPLARFADRISGR